MRLIGPLQELVRTFEYLAAQAQINLVYLQTVFRVMGVAYLTGFTAQICRDAGEGALALKLEMAGSDHPIAVGPRGHPRNGPADALKVKKMKYLNCPVWRGLAHRNRWRRGGYRNG